MTSVFIDGGAGTTGLGIRDRLAGRSDLSMIVLDEARRKDPAARREALNDADVAILCLPDDAARDAVALIDTNTRVIDASSAHRTAAGWTYGFAELEPDRAARIAQARRVSNPGCYPTAFLALVRPMVRAGVIPSDWPMSYHATSGYSGGGNAMIAEFEEGGTETAFRAYALSLSHKHLPEMTVHSGLDRPPVFSPSVARVARGMLGEVPLSLALLPRAPSPDDLTALLIAAYASRDLVQVDTCNTPTVTIEENVGTDRLTLRVCGNAVNGQARLVATLDNLGKGAAGAAVQNLNLMIGADPLAGLIV